MADEHTDDDVVAWLDGLRAAAAERYPVPPPALLRYGDEPDQVVDLWGDTEAEVLVVSIHGGYFRAHFDRTLNEPLCRAVAAAGACAANIEYRREGAVEHPLDTVGDVRAALDAVLAARATAPARVVVTGHSAGGYLALAVAAHPGIDAVLPLAPATDPQRCHDEGVDTGDIRHWVGALPEHDPHRWESLRLDYSGWHGLPIRVLHGDRDALVPLQHSTDLQAEGAAFEVEVLPGVGHFEFLDCDTPAVARTVELAILGW